MYAYIKPFIYLLEEMAPYLLLGFLVAGLLHAFVPRQLYRKWLAGNDLKSVLLSIAFGVPLPLCSCGVIPAAVSMHRQGASKGATTAFLISTPQTGVDSIAATWSVLGFPFAIMRPIVAMLTGLFGGLVTNAAVRREKPFPGAAGTEEEHSSCGDCEEKRGFRAKLRTALHYGFSDMIDDIGKWLVIGLLIAGLITIFVPDDFFASYRGNYLLNMVLILAVSIPMYICATGSIPIAAALILKGLSPGAALVLLMAGPATNAASILVLGKTLGRRTLAVYLASIIAGAVAAGIIVDSFLPQEWFTSTVKAAYHHHSGHMHGAADAHSWWKLASAAVVIILLIRSAVSGLAARRRSGKAEATAGEGTKAYLVKGMTCNHCRETVQKAIESLEGVEKAEVDLKSGKVSVKGEVPPEKVVKAVEDRGYECSEL